MIRDVQSDIQTGRSAGFSESNNYAFFLALFFPILLSQFLFQNNRLHKIFWLICCLFIVIGLVLTGSRSGTISFIVSILAYLWFIKSLKTIKIIAIMRIAAMLVVFSIAAYLIAPAQLKEQTAIRFNPKNYQSVEEFSNARIPGLRNSLVLFLESPIWGHGLGSYLPLVEKRQFEVQLNSHIEYLVYLVNFGVIGLIIYIMILIKVYQHMCYHIKTTTDQWNKVHYISYLAGFLGYVIFMLFCNVFHIRILFWLYTAVIYKYSLIDMNNRDETGTVKR
jgi:O-antigen ligase